MKKRTTASLDAEAKFRGRVLELGGVVLEEGWLGASKPHRIRCPRGHAAAPRPQSVNIGNGICETCGYSREHRRGLDSRTTRAAAAFRAKVAELGGVLIEPEWIGSQVPHRVRCAEGHECAPRPNNVMQGSGLCVTCSWSSQDVVYVVLNETESRVKFGITNGDMRPRMRAHRRDGYSVVLRHWSGLPGGVAIRVEQSVLRVLSAAGVNPVHGREYFDAVHTSRIVDMLASRLHQYL